MKKYLVVSTIALALLFLQQTRVLTVSQSQSFKDPVPDDPKP